MTVPENIHKIQLRLKVLRPGIKKETGGSWKRQNKVMATIKNIFSGEYTAAGGRYREYENQVVSKSALNKIYNL